MYCNTVKIPFAKNENKQIQHTYLVHAKTLFAQVTLLLGDREAQYW